MRRSCVDQHLVDQHPDQPAVDAVGVPDVRGPRREAGDRVGAVAADDEAQPLGVLRPADEAVGELRRVEERQIVHAGRHATVRPMIAFLVVVHSLVCVLLIFLVLMHSGKDAGLSGAFGVGGSSSAYGGSTAIVEKNLDRVTVVAAVLFFVTTFFLARRGRGSSSARPPRGTGRAPRPTRRPRPGAAGSWRSARRRPARRWRRSEPGAPRSAVVG